MIRRQDIVTYPPIDPSINTTEIGLLGVFYAGVLALGVVGASLPVRAVMEHGLGGLSDFIPGMNQAQAAPAFSLAPPATPVSLPLYVAAGEAGSIATSADLRTWTTVSSGFGGRINGLAAGGGLVVAVGEAGRVAVSRDGTQWSVAFQPHAFNGQTIHRVAFGNGVFVAVGEGNVVATSPDGTEWTARPSEFDAPAPGNGIQAVAYSASGFIATGGGIQNAMRSPSGERWVASAASVPGEGRRGVVEGNGRVVTVGDAGLLRLSVDGGLNWWNCEGAGAVRLNQVAFGDDHFLAVGEHGTVVTSDADGARWSAHTLASAKGSRAEGDWYDVTYDGAVFVLVGTAPDGQTGRIAISHDGTHVLSDVALNAPGLRAVTVLR